MAYETIQHQNLPINIPYYISIFQQKLQQLQDFVLYPKYIESKGVKKGNQNTIEIKKIEFKNEDDIESILTEEQRE